MNTPTPTRDELLKELDWALAEGFTGPRSTALLVNLRSLLSANQAQAEPQSAEDYISTLPADWHRDSSLEKWFPLTAKELESTRHMFHAACASLGAINHALGLDPDDGGEEPILDAIEVLKASSDQQTVDELKRRLADMCLEYEALAVKADQTWNEAIAAAALICDGVNNHDNPMTAADCADAIRALARPSQEQEPATPCQNADHMGKFACQDRSQCWEPCGELGHSAEHAKVSRPVSGAVDEREAFEAWAGGANVTRNQFGDYVNTFIDGQWQAWQSRAELARAQQAPAVSEAITVCDFLLNSAYICDADAQVKIMAAGLAKVRGILVRSESAAAPVSEQTEWMRPKFVTKEQSQ